ncbi:MAG TPA: phosphatase PAP2 family protein [Polyangiaceae bacterium]|nr:phosphatase PAP2 family protein [Polyangiaceae bacterium]
MRRIGFSLSGAPAADGSAQLSELAVRAPRQRALSQRFLAVLAAIAPLLPFAATGALYELLRGVFRQHGPVHVRDLLALEQRFFSVSTQHGPRALSEVIAQRTHVWLDVTCGLTYLLFLIEILAVSAALSARWRSRAWELSLGFLIVNLLGWMIWMAYPAAPPWYADAFALQGSTPEVASSAAGLARFDALVGLPVAASFYAKSADVFGAMPSLHVAYATLVVWAVAPLGRWPFCAAALFASSMAFSAIYLRHHYILDVLAGMLLAITVAGCICVVRRLAVRRGPVLGLARVRTPRDRGGSG